MALAAFGLPRALRLRRRRDFSFLSRVGVRGNADALTVLVRPVRRGQHGRVGLTVPRKVGKAHERNLVKRRLRHWLRHRKLLFADHDLVVIAKEGAASLPFEELGRQLERAIERAQESLKRRRSAPSVPPRTRPQERRTDRG
ncbi:MAG: ribonuclease P protein component [Myxococcota bacterium]